MRAVWHYTDPSELFLVIHKCVASYFMCGFVFNQGIQKNE